MEANYMVDEIVGSTAFNIGELPRNTWEKKTFVFNDVSSTAYWLHNRFNAF